MTGSRSSSPLQDVLDRQLTIMLLGRLFSSYDEIIKREEVTYVAGGAAQNCARGAAVSGSEL